MVAAFAVSHLAGLWANCSALAQDAPIRILTPAETVQIEHDDRKRRLLRLSSATDEATPPKFFDYVIKHSELKLKSLPVDIPLLRVVFDTRVFFDFDKHDLRPEAQSVIDTVAASLRKEPPDVSLFVAGHTDGVGTDDYNYELGLRRARVVAEALAARDIRQVRIFRVSFGKKVPVASNETDIGRAENRRVEFLFAAHSDAIALWLSKQPAALCDKGQKACRFEVDIVNPPKKAELPAPPAGVDLSKPKQSADIKEVKPAPADVSTSLAVVAPTTKRYVIDLSQKKFEIPNVTR